MQQTDGTNTLNFSYSSDGRPLAVNFDGTNYYYLYNLQGDVIGLYNTSGTVVVQYTYDSWGVLLSTTGSLASTLGALNPFRYRGYIYDEETELYWLRSRYYDPETGRFLNADGYISTGTGLSGYNMFAYCNNNPVLFSDFLGNRPAVGASTEYETPEEKFLSFATMNNIQFKTMQTDFSGNMYIVDKKTQNNTNSSSTQELLKNSGNGYWVVIDGRQNGYVEIINSCQTFNISHQADILNTLLHYTSDNSISPTQWYRTTSSMFIEWTWHNFVYSLGIMRSSSVSACFDMYPYCNSNSFILQVLGECKKRGWW